MRELQLKKSHWLSIVFYNSSQTPAFSPSTPSLLLSSLFICLYVELNMYAHLLSGYIYIYKISIWKRTHVLTFQLFISVYIVMHSKDLWITFLWAFFFFFPSRFTGQIFPRLEEKGNTWHMLILFAWGRCWNLSLEAHLFISNSGAEPHFPETAFLLGKQTLLVCCCRHLHCCFGFIVFWLFGFNSTWADHLVSDVTFCRIFSSFLWRPFNKAWPQSSRFPGQWILVRPGGRQRVRIPPVTKKTSHLFFSILPPCPSLLTKAMTVIVFNGLEQSSAFSWNRF